MPNIATLDRPIPRANRHQAVTYAETLREFNNGNLYGVWDLDVYKVFSYDTIIAAVTSDGLAFQSQSYYSNTTSRHQGIANGVLRHESVRSVNGFAYHGELGNSAHVDLQNRIATVRERVA